jgi:hypothetical protein
MAGFTDNTQPPIEGAAIVARALGVDEATLRLALQQVGAIQRPVGLQLFGAITMQDARKTLGLSLDPAIGLARYTYAR